MSLPAPFVRLERVTQRFANGGLGLQDIELTLGTGQLTALVGPSGCGKTTLLKILGGLAAPSGGQVVWQERAPPAKGYVFQSPTLMPWADVAHNITLPLVLAGAAPQPEKLIRLLQETGLSDKRTALPHQLSGGQQMRVSLARALMGSPRLLLLDEPFAALDEITRQRLSELVCALHRAQQLTIVFVTHNIAEAVFMADRVVLMQGPPGRIVQSIKINGPQVRDQAFRADPSYHAQCARLSAELAAMV
jgi:NitT/TauT family transport system ATP-binding protein